MSDENTHTWELAWKEGRWQELSPPLQSVIDFSQLLKKAGARRVLDLGCGAGRHVLYLAKQGFQVVALDVAESALRMLDERQRNLGLVNISIVKHDMSDLPFIDGHFDGVISTNVIHHGKIYEIRRTIGEIYRVMRNGGLGFIITISENDYKMGRGRLLEPATYVITEGDEEGIVHHFFTREELLSLLGRFEILSFDEEIVPFEKGDRAHFNITFRKST